MSENKETPEVVDETPQGGCGCGCSCGGGKSEEYPYVWDKEPPASPPKRGGGRSLLLILVLGMLFAGGLSMATAMAGDGSAAADGSCQGSACPFMRLKEAIFPSQGACGAKAGACPLSGAPVETAPASGQAKLRETAAPLVDASVHVGTVSAALAYGGTQRPGDQKPCCKGKSCGGKDKE